MLGASKRGEIDLEVESLQLTYRRYSGIVNPMLDVTQHHLAWPCFTPERYFDTFLLVTAALQHDRHRDLQS